MRLLKTKRYKTDPKNPSGLARCDFCGFAVNGNKLHKYMQYSGALFADYSVPNKYMSQGDVMGDGQMRWNGMMVCSHCLDVPNQQSNYRAQTADPFTADGNRPMPPLTAFFDDFYDNLLLENGSSLLLETGGKILITLPQDSFFGELLLQDGGSLLLQDDGQFLLESRPNL